MSFNESGISTVVNNSFELWNYMAYGTGTVGDNDTALGNEIDRVPIYETTAYSNYFTITATIGINEGNGNKLTEYGLAIADPGNISTTHNSYPMIKNTHYEVIMYSTIIVSNLI